LVFGAQAAVEGAALVGAGAEGARQPGRLAVVVTVVVGDVGADEIVEGAVLGAAFAEVDAPVLDDDLGVHDAAALRAEAAGGAEVGVVAELHGGIIPLSFSREPCRALSGARERAPRLADKRAATPRPGRRRSRPRTRPLPLRS